MELRNLNKSEVEKAFNLLLVKARNSSNAKKAGEKSKPTMIDDGLTINDINGYSIQYTTEYSNYLVTVFNGNKGYSLKIKEQNLKKWLMVLVSLPSIYEEDLDFELEEDDEYDEFTQM